MDVSYASRGCEARDTRVGARGRLASPVRNLDERRDARRRPARTTPRFSSRFCRSAARVNPDPWALFPSLAVSIQSTLGATHIQTATYCFGASDGHQLWEFHQLSRWVWIKCHLLVKLYSSRKAPIIIIFRNLFQM